MLLRPDVQPLALDVLHDKVRRAVVHRSPVQQTGDTGMSQAGQDLPFFTEPRDVSGRKKTSRQQLDRCTLLVLLIVADRFPNHAHAAPADLAKQPPRTDFPAFERMRFIAVKKLRRLLIHLQERAEFRQYFIILSLRIDESAAISRWQQQGRIEKILDAGPVSWTHGLGSAPSNLR